MDALDVAKITTLYWCETEHDALLRTAMSHDRVSYRTLSKDEVSLFHLLIMVVITVKCMLINTEFSRIGLINFVRDVTN